MLATAASRQRVQRRQGDAARRGVRGRVGQGQQRRPRRLRPDRLRPGRSVNGVDPETVARLFGSYEEVKRSQSRMDMEDVLLLTRRDARRRRARRRAGAPPVQVVRRRRVPGRLAAPVGAARPVARWPRRGLRRRRPGADDLLLRGRRRDLPDRVPLAPPRHRTSIDLVRNYRSTPRWSPRPTPCWPAPRARGSSGGPSAPRARGDLHAYPDEVAEAEAVAAAVDRLREAGTPPRRSRCCSASTPSPRPYEEALRGRGVPYVVRGAARFFDRPEVREAVTRLRGSARGGEGGSDVVADVRRDSGGDGLDPRGADRPRPDPRPLGVAAGPRRPGRRAGRRDPAARCRGLRRRPRPPRLRAARPGRRGRHPGHPPRRQGSRVGRRVRGAASARAPCRSPTPRRPPRSRRSAGCSTSASPAPAHTSRCPGRWPATRAAARQRQPSRFLDPLLPAGPRAGPVPAGRGAQPPGRQLPRVRQAAGHRAGEEARPLRTTARRPTTRSCSRGCAPGARARAGRGERARVRRLHRRHAAADRRAQARSAQALLRINGIGQTKLDRYGRTSGSRPRAAVVGG